MRIDKAQHAWEQGRYDDAIRYYEAALARSPRNPVLLIDVARAYALRFRYERAEKLISLAQSLYPDDAHLHQMLGRSYVMLQQFDRALICYERCLELNPRSPDRPKILLEAAKMHERLHHLELARVCVQEAIALAPNLAQAQYVQATLDRRAGELAAAEATWRSLIESDRSPPGVTADSHYQLAALNDAEGHFDEAYSHLTRAKEILNRAAMRYREEAAAIAATTRRTVSAVTTEHCRRWHAARDKLKPLAGRLALLASHPRSGTTLLEQVLDSHPGIKSADELQVMAEIVYMPLGQKFHGSGSVPEALDCMSVEVLDNARQAYWTAMEGALREPLRGQLLIDKNPELTMLLPVIARTFPEMKILFALRDPRDVVISCFMQRLPLNAVSVHYLTLEATAKKYAATMRAWLKIRELLGNDWLEVRYEDTVGDLEQQAQKVLGFLELPWDDSVLHYYKRAQNKHVHSPTYEAVTKPIYSSSVGRWRNYAEQLEPALEILQPFVEAFGYV